MWYETWNGFKHKYIIIFNDEYFNFNDERFENIFKLISSVDSYHGTALYYFEFLSNLSSKEIDTLLKTQFDIKANEHYILFARYKRIK